MALITIFLGICMKHFQHCLTSINSHIAASGVNAEGHNDVPPHCLLWPLYDLQHLWKGVHQHAPLSSLLLLILFPQEFPSDPRWWGETSSQCSSMRIIPTLRRRRPTKSHPAHYQCLSSSRSLFETKCDNLLSYRDTLLPANMLSSVNIFSPSHAEHIWYF